MATYQELRTRSQQVRDEQNIGGNTALRVGQLLMDIVKYFYDNDMAASEYLEQHFAMVNDGTHLLNWQQSPIVILHTMGDGYDDGDFSALSQGENYYRAGWIMEANGQGGGINGETPKANVLYVNLANDTLYTWNGASFDAITSGGGGSISGDDILKNAYYLNGNLVLVFETESGDKTVTIPVNFDASNYVPTSRTVNGKALSNNITLSQSDIPGLVAALAAKVGYSDDEWLQVKAGAIQATTAVQDTTTVNGKRLNNNITIQMADIPGLLHAISEAGEVKSVTINGTNHTPNSSGVVDLGTIQGEKGDKGDAGDVNITDGQLNELTVVNDLEHNTQGDGAVLSAYMGYVLGLSMGKITNANDGKKYNVWVGTQAELDALNEDYDADTIYIVGTVPVVAQRYNIAFNGTHTTIPSNTPTSVKGGSAFSVVVSAVSGYAISSATGTMVGGTLTKTENQDGTVTFSTSSVTGDISITASASVDSNAPIVWEDSTMEAFMLGKVTHANPNYITINEAASYTNSAFSSPESTGTYQFNDIKGVVTKFNEWQYFTGLTKINLSNFTALTEVTMPSTVLIETRLVGASYSGTLFSGTLIQEVEIPSGVTSFDGKSFESCAELENIIFPATLTTLVSLPDKCPKLRTIDFSGTSLGAYTLDHAKTDAEIIKLPPSLETMQKSDGSAIQLTRFMPNIRYIEFGTAQGGSQISSIKVGDYLGKYVALILHTATPPTFSWTDNAPSAIYVPDAAVATYQAASGFSTHSSKIKGLSELPSGWDTTTAN